MTNAVDEAITVFKERKDKARANWIAHRTVDSSQIMRAQSDVVLPGLAAAAKAYVGHAFVGRSFIGADPAVKEAGAKSLRFSEKTFRPVQRKTGKKSPGTNRHQYVFPDFPPAIVKAIDDEALLHGLAEYVLEEASREDIHLLITALRAVMCYDLTKNSLWDEVLKTQPSTRLYLCDPEPDSFTINAAKAISGRVNVLVDFETEVMPGHERRVSAIIPTRFYLTTEDGVPQVMAVELHA